MKRYNVLCLCLIIFGLFPLTQSKSQKQAPVNDNFRTEKIAAPSLANNIINLPEEQKVLICVPPNYLQEQQIRFPVLYFLTGYMEEPDYYVNELYQGLKMNESLEALVESGVIKKMIIVIAGSSNFLGGGFFVNSEAGGNWEDFITKDLVSFVDSHYRTIADPLKRGIAGYSMGGFGAINIAMKHPDIFSSVYALSPGLFDKNGLSNSPMFADKNITEKFLNCESQSVGMEKDKAHERFRNYCDNTRDMDLIYTFAYGIAFAPNASKKAPYIDFPYSKEGNRMVQNKEIWKKWENGFGNWNEKIKTYKENLLKLKGICIDYGTKEEDKWRIDGCKFLIKELNNEKIQAKLLTFAGQHSDKIRERIEKSILPYFSKIFESN